MLARTVTILKWTLYSAAVVLCVMFQGAILQRMVFWGVIPFLYPLLAAIPATYEEPIPATVFSLAVGIFCDLLLPGSIPCLYTLIFPLVGLFASLLSQSVLPPGLVCSFLAGAMSFLLTDGFRGFVLWINGRAAWQAAGFLMLREFCVTAPLIIPLSFLFRAVSRKARRMLDA